LARLTLRPRGPWAVRRRRTIRTRIGGVQLPRVPLALRRYAELVAQGVPILRGPTDLPDWRHRTLFFRDPEDNIIEIYAEY
jgi:glyoxylase I family protein